MKTVYHKIAKKKRRRDIAKPSTERLTGAEIAEGGVRPYLSD